MSEQSAMSEQRANREQHDAIFSSAPFIAANAQPGLLETDVPGHHWCGEVTYLHPRDPEGSAPSDRGCWSVGYLTGWVQNDTATVISYAVRGVRHDIDIPLADIRLDTRIPAVRDHLARGAQRRAGQSALTPNQIRALIATTLNESDLGNLDHLDGFLCGLLWALRGKEPEEDGLTYDLARVFCLADIPHTVTGETVEWPLPGEPEWPFGA